MFEINGQKVFVGDFHGQWWDEAELPLNLAALTLTGYDFTLFNSGDTSPDGPLANMARRLGLPLAILPWGKECFYDWSHLMVGGFKQFDQMPPIDSPDHLAVLKQLRPLCDFISLAHPYTLFADKLDHVIDTKLADAIELKESQDGFWLLEWYQARLAKGVPTPIVTGVDFHATAGKRSGCVFYNSLEEARPDVHDFGDYKTLVFCDDCDPATIYAAVKNCRSVVEVQGRLVGPPDLVRELEAANYPELSRRLQIERERATLRLLDGKIPIEGEPVRLQAQGETFELPPQSDSSGKPSFHVPVKVGTQCRAVKVRAALEAELYPLVRPDGGAAVKIRVTNNSFEHRASGKLELVAEGLRAAFDYRDLPPRGRFERKVELPLLQDPDIAKSFRLTLRPDTLPERTIVRRLVFVAVRGSANWEDATPLRLDREEQLDKVWLGKWGGPADCSMTAKLRWDATALHLRFHVVDDILATSAKPELKFMGDCIQIGINPLDSCHIPAFSFHSFVASRGAEPQEEFCQVEAHPRLSCGDIIDMPYLLPAQFRQLRRLSPTETELILSFPWSLLAPLEPKAGTRFQLYLILWDNDGNGPKAALQWPVAKPGAWYSPDNYGDWASLELQ